MVQGVLCEFKEFAMRGNVIDLAVGVIIGGAFINTVVDFLIIVSVIFMAIEAINSLRRQEAAAPPPAATPEEVVLLRDIRDALQRKE